MFQYYFVATMMSPPWSVNYVKVGENEMCHSLPKVIIHYAESSRVWLLSESLRCV